MYSFLKPDQELIIKLNQQVIETKKDGQSSQNNTSNKLREISEEVPGKNPFSALDDLEGESSKKNSSAPTSKTSLQEVKRTNSDDTNQGCSTMNEQEKCSIRRTQSGPNRKFNLHQMTVLRKIALQLQSLENKQYVVNNGQCQDFCLTQELSNIKLADSIFQTTCKPRKVD